MTADALISAAARSFQTCELAGASSSLSLHPPCPSRILQLSSFPPCACCHISNAEVLTAIAMSLAKRKHPLPRRDASPKRPRSSPTSPDSVLPLLQLGHHVHDLGVKVFAFREKGLPYFARLNEQRVLPDPEGTPCPAPTAFKAEQEDLRLALKARLAVANETLPTLLAELAMWNTKIQLAVDVMRKGQRLPLLDDEGDEV